MQDKQFDPVPQPQPRHVPMLGLGWQEIMLIGVLAVVVVGPERLPEMLRFVGRQYAKVRRTSDELRRAFMLEADRADAEKRAAELRKRRAQAAARAEEVRRRAMEAQGGQPDLSGLEEDVPRGAVPSSVGEVPEPAQNPSKEGEQT